MYNYNNQISDYQTIRVNLPNEIREKLSENRKANQDRLISNLPDKISITRSNFIKQGSFAMWTTIQEDNNAYDIDDGVSIKKDQLKESDDQDMLAIDAKKMIKKALKDEKFDKKPSILNNCVRVFYKDGHHVDIPVYRNYKNGDEEVIQEIASVSEWKESYPERINSWFFKIVNKLNKEKDGAGIQFRRMIRLLKRFSKSRGKKWDMPSGIKLTMLVAESYEYFDREDEAFLKLLNNIYNRLSNDLVIENLADESDVKEQLTRTSDDSNIIELRDKIKDALGELAILFEDDCSAKQAREAWDWVFNTDGFFKAYDEDSEVAKSLYMKEALIKFGIASVSSTGKIISGGTPNPPHKWYGEE